MQTFAQIDQERRRLDVTQRDLCRRAGVNPATYVRLKRARNSPNERTLTRLVNALAALAREQAGGTHG